MRLCKASLGVSVAGLLFLAWSPAIANVRLSALISNNMVLQREMSVPIWGTADPAEKIVVTFHDQRHSTEADDQGRWMVRIGPLKSGGPFEMTVTGKNKIMLTNILVGEVWLCSGQSNMRLPVERAANAEKEIAAACYPRIRMFGVRKVVADQPQANIKGRWAECSPARAAKFSAVAYYFGRQIHQTLGVPIGLIESSVGATGAESWASRATLESDPDFNPILKRYEEALVVYPDKKKEFDRACRQWEQVIADAKAKGEPPPKNPPRPPLGPGHLNAPAGLYNGMIMPLVPYAIKGVIWYQGERNCGQAYQYRKLFPALIRDWRNTWGQGDFPFLFVQLANYQRQRPNPTESQWAELREAQLMTLKKVPNSAMAVTIDIGALKIHPTNKQDVGRRLALAAQAIAYHQDIIYSGPIYDSMTVEDNKIRLRFQHVGGGLVAKDSDRLMGFAIAGDDRKFVWADAKIEGDTVIVWKDCVTRPVAVRYAWAVNPACNLYNVTGLPASPFRTDQWPGITADER